MSSGGKGGETTTEIDPQVKSVMMDMAARGKELSMLPKLNYMGLTMAAPSEATQHYANQRNSQANLLGVGMAGSPLDGLPEATEINGMKGYRAWDLYKDDMQRQFNTRPGTLAKYEQFIPGQFSPELYDKNYVKPERPSGGSVPGYGGGMFNIPSLDYDTLMAIYGQGGQR